MVWFFLEHLLDAGSDLFRCSLKVLQMLGLELKAGRSYLNISLLVLPLRSQHDVVSRTSVAEDVWVPSQLSLYRVARNWTQLRSHQWFQREAPEERIGVGDPNHNHPEWDQH
ncbi:hypothetical protein SRHO_G00141600 [Serrasalmus rhombeus]